MVLSRVALDVRGLVRPLVYPLQVQEIILLFEYPKNKTKLLFVVLFSYSIILCFIIWRHKL
jgi:hypothetical protein